MRFALVAAAVVALGCSREGEALKACERAVRDQLLAPSTADFSPRRQAGIDSLPDATYFVESSVESQNAMGVPIRQRFVCLVQGTTVMEGPVIKPVLATRGECSVLTVHEGARTGMDSLEFAMEIDRDWPECRIYPPLLFDP